MTENLGLPNNKRLAIIKMYQSLSGVPVVCIEDVPELFIVGCLNLPEKLLLKTAVAIELRQTKLSLKGIAARYGVTVRLVRTIATVSFSARNKRIPLRGHSN